MIDQRTINRINKILPYLDEHQTRLYLAAESESLGRGGITKISELTGVHRNTISAGIKDLNDDITLKTKKDGSIRVRN